MKVRFFLKTLFLFNWTFLKILCLIGGKRDEDAFALTTWFRGAIFFGKLSWDCEEVADRQTGRLSKLKTGQILELSRSWGVGVFYKFPKFLVLAELSALLCCVLYAAVLCAVCCCCRLCCWWCWWESQGRRVERLTTSCLHRHQPDHCHHRRHRLVKVHVPKEQNSTNI